MGKEKIERMRKISAELGNLATNAPMPPESVLSPEAMQECLRLNWARKDSNGNFVLTGIGMAMAGSERS